MEVTPRDLLAVGLPLASTGSASRFFDLEADAAGADFVLNQPLKGLLCFFCCAVEGVGVS